MADEHNVEIATADGVVLHGDLDVPDDALGIVVFAHGSGSSRLSPRNRSVTAQLQNRGLATLLLDLLTTDEERVDDNTGELRFAVDLLADRLIAAVDWLGDQPSTAELPIGYFGASTGAGAALVAAARQPDGIAAIVSRGGRPDLAGGRLTRVQAPTLLIVGGRDTDVIGFNRDAYERMQVERRTAIVPDATHLFEEPGALERVGELAGEWFTAHLPRDSTD